MPVIGANKGGASDVLLVLNQAQPILDILPQRRRQRRESIPVVTGAERTPKKQDERAVVADQLRQVGFSIPATNLVNAERFDYQQTTIECLAGNEARAAELARYLPVKRLPCTNKCRSLPMLRSTSSLELIGRA